MSQTQVMESTSIIDAPPATLPTLAPAMRGLTKRWQIRAQVQGEGSNPLSLVQRVLAARGLVDAAEVARFCEPKLTDLHDPGLLPGIDKAVTRLIDAIRGNQLIVIYGDYDVDGITASAILFHLIKAIQP